MNSEPEEQRLKREAHELGNARHELTHTNRYNHSIPEMQELPEALERMGYVTINGQDIMGPDDMVTVDAVAHIDYAVVEQHILAYIADSFSDPVPTEYLQSLGRGFRHKIPVADNEPYYKSTYRHGLVSDTSRPAKFGKTEKALAKRRAANKAARKARRK